MLQPKEDLKLTKQEQDRNASVTKQSTTKELMRIIFSYKNILIRF